MPLDLDELMIVPSDVDAVNDKLEAAMQAAEQQVTLEQIAADSMREGIMVYDLETIPDEGRFPPPEMLTPSGVGMPLEAVIAQKLTDFTKTIATATDDELLELRTLESSSSKPRDGAFKAIDSILSGRTDEFDKWKKSCSVDPFACRIVAFGWCIGDGEPRSLTATNDDEEQRLLHAFWSLLGRDRVRCGYGITRFDDAIIINRSIAYRIEVNRRLNLKKFGNTEAVDLEQFLFPHGQPKKCKHVAKAWGINIPCPDMDGSKVYDAYKAGEIDRIAEYVRSDVAVERDIYHIASRMIASGR